MKLRNKKTGESGYYLHTHRDYKSGKIKVAVLEDGKPFSEFKPHEPIYDYDSLAELNDEWEDVPEEPKIYWSVDSDGMIISEKDKDDIYDRGSKQIGNYFETKEEAEKAVEKLKAWKRLKDKGLSFRHWKEAQLRPHSSCIAITGNMDCDAEARKDLDLLFGGEE